MGWELTGGARGPDPPAPPPSTLLNPVPSPNAPLPCQGPPPPAGLCRTLRVPPKQLNEG